MAAKKLKIHPLDDRIVVEPVEAEERTSGGIVLPDSAQEKPQRGHVVAVGPGRLLESGKRASSYWLLLVTKSSMANIQETTLRLMDTMSKSCEKVTYWQRS